MTAAWHSQDWQTISSRTTGDDPALQRQRLDLTNGQLLQEEVAHPRLAARPRSQFALNDSGSAITYAQPGELGIFILPAASPACSPAMRRNTTERASCGCRLYPGRRTRASADHPAPRPLKSSRKRFDIVAFFTEGRIRADAGRRCRTGGNSSAFNACECHHRLYARRRTWLFAIYRRS